jgi:hypothetical protein
MRKSQTLILDAASKMAVSQETMTRAFKEIVAIIVLSLSISAIVDAGPFEDAGVAYDRGDYAAAMRLYRQMADQAATPSSVSGRCMTPVVA